MIPIRRLGMVSKGGGWTDTSATCATTQIYALFRGLCMMSGNINIQSIRIGELANQLPGDVFLFEGGRSTVSVASLAPNEAGAVTMAFNQGLAILRKVAPSIAAEMQNQLPVALAMATLAKGTLSSTGAVKQITYPSQVGTIGVNWLFPQAVKYIATASATNPAYTDYSNDSWNIPLTAGSLANILGSGTLTANTPPTTVGTVAINNRYQACSLQNQHEFWFVFQNGLLEIGSTPAIEQWHIETAQANQYGIYTTSPINEQPIEMNKAIYQYNTLGVIPVYFDSGINWYGLPQTTQTSQLKLLGMTFYEHDLFPTVQTI
jgi:hypothetical protein